MEIEMDDITPPKLKPRAKFFEEAGEDMINADGAIALMRTIDTPQAKALNAAFRKALVRVQRDRKDLTPEKQREEALFACFDDVGIKTNDMGTLSGTMDD